MKPAKNTFKNPEALIQRLLGRPIPEIAAILDALTDVQLAALETALSVEFAMKLAEAAVTDSAVIYDLFAVRPRPGQITAIVGLRDLLRTVRDEAVARKEFGRVLV